VVDKRGKLIAIVAEKDLLYASPSPATSLSMHEIPYLLTKVKVEHVMTKDVITVTEDTPLEEAARIMADHNVGGLPVLRDGELVGIITETDIFKALLEVLGAREESVRLTMRVPERNGVLPKIVNKVAELNGHILTLGSIIDKNPSNRQLTIRVADIPEAQLISAIEGLGIETLDARYCTTPTCAE
jgi:acetoin utilization protein AcuB